MPVSVLAILTGLVALFELWWVIAYFHAYRQVGERILLLQVVQAAAIGGLFAYFTVALASNSPINGTLSIVVLLISMGASLVWRMRGGVNHLIRRYPRGMIDVLSFRRPAVDLKRRVRSK